MRYSILTLLFLSATTVAVAQNDSIAHSLKIESVDITAQRPLRSIGVQHASVDTVALRENITSSLSDVLAQNSNIFIKSYGRATLATASFRGTSPSHTQVTWNDMKLNSPMLGQVDFSLIPSYFIDAADIYYGASSVSVAGGGLGGAIALTTRPSVSQADGLGLKYIQGVGSFSTFDEFIQLTYSAKRWSSSTRVIYSSSKNDFKYRIRDFMTDDKGQITGVHFPEKRNKNGDFADLHIQQELYYTTKGGSRLSLAGWYLDSHRGLALLNTDKNEAKEKKNTQDERTLRVVAGWDMIRGSLKLTAKVGYTYTNMLYLFLADAEGKGQFDEMIHAQSNVHTGFVKAEAEYCIGRNWMFTANLTAHQNYVRSSDMSVIENSQSEGIDSLVSYRQARFELSGFASIKWRPTERLGLAVNIREEMFGSKFSPVIPAVFIDYLASKRGNVLLKASFSRNFRYPTLNDLYFRPGGNPNLKPERGYTYDGGAEFSLKTAKSDSRLSITAFNSNIDDWILWINSPKLGISSPVNIKRVESYGVESKLYTALDMGRRWRASLDANFAWTRSINRGEPFSEADESVGKQLIYIPEFSSAFTARLSWRDWTATYKWCWYSKRFTTSSNVLSRLGYVKPYFMNDISLERTVSLRWAELSFKGCVNNLFNEEYESVLSRPMPRRNFSIFIGITPKFKRR